MLPALRTMGKASRLKTPVVTMPAGWTPAGTATGELESSVRVPPLLMAKAPTVPTRLSFTYSVRPSGLTLGSVAPTPAVLLTTVLPMSVRDPLGAIW